MTAKQQAFRLVLLEVFSGKEEKACIWANSPFGVTRFLCHHSKSSN